MATIELNGLTYFYRIAGAGRPLVLLHGFTGSSENWSETAADLAHDFRLIMLDLPGHGRSAAPADPGRLAMENVAADLADLFRALELPPVNLLGYSMGGRLALYMAAHHSRDLGSLILESASPGLAGEGERRERREADERLASEIEAHGIPAFIDRWQNLPLFATQANAPTQKQERQRQQRLNNSIAGLANSLRGMGTGKQPSLWSELPGVALPALLLAGELDAKFVELARRMGAELPHAQVQVIPDAGHNIHFERPQRFAAAVRSFLGHLK